jgi:hypothetical protein
MQMQGLVKGRDTRGEESCRAENIGIWGTWVVFFVRGSSFFWLLSEEKVLRYRNLCDLRVFLRE